MNFRPRLLAKVVNLRPRDAVILLFFLTIVILSVLFFSRFRKESSIAIVASQNKFQVNFDIAKKDQEKVTQILSDLNLPKSAKAGFEFATDATTSAKLAFASPINLKFNLKDKKITVRGVHGSKVKEFERLNFKVPANTNLAVFAESFKDFVKSRFTLPANFKDWLDQNLSSESGQYLMVIGSTPHFALAWQNANVNLDVLKDLSTNDLQYKEEQEDNVNLHLIKLTPKDQEQPTFTIFKIGQWYFLTSSREIAQNVIKVQKSQAPSIAFDVDRKAEKSALSLLLLNAPENPASDNLIGMFFPERAQVPKNLLSQIAQIQFTLKANDFSGLIILK